MSVTTRGKAAMGGAIVGLLLLALTIRPLFAETPTPTPSAGATSGTTITHEQMDRMMDAVHGEGTSPAMHEAMGPDAEKLMDQCVSMMTMMQSMQGMMGGQNGQSMWDMMSR